ncbi:BTAD domain-containing putative transcriptional regulator [Uniformispora flossi]
MVLASLTAARPSSVAPERLVDDLWGGNPPTTALTALQVCVSRLRSALEPGRRPRTPSKLLVTTSVGYELRPPAGAVDADRFVSGVDDAQAAAADGDPAAALSRVDAALTLWKGAAYADTADLPGPREEAGRLTELRLAAAEMRLDALLALRRHAEVVLDAERLTREHPFRERLAELWALALYRGGRQADALAVLAANRRRLADELGVDPCPIVRDLERDILRQAPRLDVGDVTGMGVVAGTQTWLASGAEVGRGTGPQAGGAGVAGAGAGTSAGAGAEANAGSGTEAGTRPGSHAQASTGTGTEASPGTEANEGPGTPAKVGPGTGSVAGTGVGASASMGSQADAVPGAGAGAARDARAGAGSGTQAGARPPGVEAGVGASTGTQATGDPHTGTHPGAEVDTATGATTGADTTTDRGAQVRTGATPGAHAEASARTDTGRHARTGTSMETTAGAGTPANAGSSTGTPASMGPSAKAGAEPAVRAGAETATGANAGAETGPNAGPEPGRHAHAQECATTDRDAQASGGAVPHAHTQPYTSTDQAARAGTSVGPQAHTGAEPGTSGRAETGASTSGLATSGPQAHASAAAEAGTDKDSGTQAHTDTPARARTQADARAGAAAAADASTSAAPQTHTGTGPQAAPTSAATQAHETHRPTPTSAPPNDPHTPNVLSPLTNGAPEDASPRGTSLPPRDPDGRRATFIPPPGGPLPHIGRYPQRNALAQALADTRAGHGALVVISGEPGIGKTRLLAELERLAGEVGVRVLRGRCPETDAAPAFWPWHAVLRNLRPATPAPTPMPRPAPAHASPPTVLGPLPDDPSADAVGFASASAPLRVYESVTHALITDATANGPVAVVLDDIHWADPSSLHLLGYAAEMLAGQPVLLAVTLRDNHARSDSALDACLATLARLHPLRLRLSGLDPAEIGELLRQSVRTDIDGATANLIHARADGNPFYARELARLLGRDADFDLHSSAIPDGVRDVVRRRVGLISETTRTLLRLASVVGRDVDVDLLAAVSGTPFDDLVDACDAAVVHGLLEETGLARYRFTHALVRETLYDDLGAGRRGRMHGDIGAVLEVWLPERPELLDSVAYHLAFGAALRPALVGSAARHGIAAARQAGLQYAYDDACARWERTADLVAGRRGVDARVRFDVMHGLGVARRRVGDLAGAKRALGEAIRLARELADIELVALAAIAVGGTELWNWREYTEVDHEVIAVLEQCRTELPPGPLRCRATAGLAVELVFTWDAERSDTLATEAVAEARELGDPETLAYALGCHYLATWFPGTAAARLATTEELTDLAVVSGHADVELVARFFRGIVLLELGRVAESDEQRAACAALVARLRRSSSAIQMQWWDFLRMHMAGRTADLAAILPAAVRQHRATTLVGHAECEGNALAQVAELEGNLAGALPQLIELVKGSPYPAFHAQVARAALLSGRPDLAAQHLPPASPPAFAGSWQSLATDCLRVEVLAGLGRIDEVRVAMDRIRPHADGPAVYGSIAYLGSVRYFLGVGAAACGDRAQAIRELGAAVAANAAYGALPWQARSERKLAELVDDMPE